MNETKKQFNKMKFLQESSFGVEEINEFKKNQTLLVDTAYEFINDADYDRAFELFCMGLESDNTDPDMLNGLGITLCELNRLEEARLVLQRAIRFNPTDAITIANLAGVCWELGDYEKAIYFYTKSLENDNELDDVYYNLINLYIETDSIYMAFIVCLEFIDKFPDSEDARELLDDIILNLGLMIM